ncbi:hypothetical protein [Parasulfitobacter algicola]|uniref:Uncharacterized protein n=1 Tax=Parasulfitobacter algicola TaxID=2614809 RepID=A0ABX2ITZ6_9RHOB|nr:hypothetical protein [Sulfitobacter algicola]NSX56025.1 hypothetical protein [Sulfitobacter algicola]
MDLQRIQKDIQKVSTLMEQKLSLRGKTLGQKAKRAKRFLPRYLIKNAEYLDSVLKLTENPKLIPMIDQVRVDRAIKGLTRYLNTIDEKKRRRTALLNAFSIAGLNILLVGVALAVFLYWQGYL